MVAVRRAPVAAEAVAAGDGLSALGSMRSTFAAWRPAKYATAASAKLTPARVAVDQRRQGNGGFITDPLIRWNSMSSSGLVQVSERHGRPARGLEGTGETPVLQKP